MVFWEVGYSGNTGLGLGLSHIVGHYLMNFGTEAQRLRWLPGIASGEIIAAIAMTEPGTGSDLQGVRTRAERRGDNYVINGAKTFISNGQLCDLVVVAKTDPAQGSKGISLFLVDTGTLGFQRGQVLEKLGMEGQDMSEMFFDDCTVPADCLIGEQEGRGLYQLMEQRAFGKALIEFQNTRFVLADVKATVTATRAFTDMLVQQWIDGTLDAATASMGRFWCTERQCEVMDQCLQLFGGYGYMKEYPIARRYADARVQRIYGGSNEIQRELVGRQR